MLPRGSDGGPVRYALARLPIRPDRLAARRATAIVTFDPFVEHRSFPYDPALGSARWTILNDVVGAVLLDLHRDLAKAWAAIIAAGRPPELEELLTRPPFTHSELLAIAEESWKDPDTRNRLLGEWARDAKRRYEEVRRLARAVRRDDS